ncbi:MAG: formate--tetrahydrofolate ligase [Nitrospirae bacterium CG_4_10_14_0_8_um_filter_41_23]|nr:formate--tetrahydrofolate ligase [Nitrospirota bacterium]OIP61110.1 MAG: formate--tetrahydrofolate ligase [Nitrospirae bacterium CG2_30_41_42]PIQ93806.1 MAG: formate--tetrahydrofolate ligase [Nitrospirae bacterium CG11_big_fil_rev_8_21_14_0_20_41_14]PIV42407.1 MAG: formate--tetrahydrofolate ligase [Nitrospirae bacterium CG02_land_8_20_14_3_00_41_53]PIW88313.1 MAG: formate--tetrahydrofolate ligase [Nitrospirae bacterium CG_4_8_14_3_um_filter_41_47]PIY86126.1 MAG: formate--tetrahydrofolate li
MPIDPTKHADWEIAEAAEKTMKTSQQLADELGIENDELLPYGHYIAKVDYAQVLERLKDRPDGKFIEVTAITPTPLGEGKSTTTMGLLQGMGKRGKKVTACIRQPSGGPTMNIKGSAAGGGLSQCIPLTEFSLGLTGDINAVMNAHNLAMVALTARMQHESNYNDEQLSKRNLKRLNIDPRNVEMGWVIDFCAQALRNIVIGIGGKMDGFTMQSKFGIAVSSEVMAILAIFSDLADFRKRIGGIVVAYDKQGNPVTTEDLEVAGAMTAWMRNAINPNLLQSIEGQPCFVHAGPFANIAVGQSSVVADKMCLKLADYHITESGFGADIGFEKFWNVKCRYSGNIPNVSVITATIRALKHHGVNAGAPPVVPGRPIPKEYFKENLAWLEDGMTNVIHHINTVKKAGINPVVCINRFHNDTEEEVKLTRKMCEAAGARVAVSQHWQYGGEGALELADAVLDACNDRVNFKFLYDMDTPLRKRIELIAREVYGADGVTTSREAGAKAEKFEKDPKFKDYATMMVKTHLSLSDDPAIKGVPNGWTLRIRDFLIYGGARFICPVAGNISLMPGTSSDPAYRRVDVDVKTGKVKGLF